MDLKQVAVVKDGNTLIKDAKGKTDNGRLQVFAKAPPRLLKGDKITIEAAGDFKATGIYMDENPRGTLNFKID